MISDPQRAGSSTELESGTPTLSNVAPFAQYLLSVFASLTSFPKSELAAIGESEKVLLQVLQFCQNAG